MNYRVEKTAVREWSLYKGKKFVRSFDNKRDAQKTLTHVQEDDRKPVKPAARVAAAPHKFIVRFQLRTGQRKSFELRAPSMCEAAALFFAMTGLSLSKLSKATIMYNGSRKARDLVEVLS